jgi:hypothetical protein
VPPNSKVQSLIDIAGDPGGTAAGGRRFESGIARVAVPAAESLAVDVPDDGTLVDRTGGDAGRVFPCGCGMRDARMA